MERIRRTKLCLYLKKRRPNKRKKSKSKKTGIHYQGLNVNTCTNHPDIGHYFQDKINYVHVLADVILTAKYLHKHTSWHWTALYTYTPPYESNMYQHRKLSNACNNLSILTKEVNDADKNRAWCSAAKGIQTMFSQMEGNQNRKVRESGNYIIQSHRLVEMAKLSVSCSKNIQEKNIILKKLKLFQALCEVLEIKKRYPAI